MMFSENNEDLEKDGVVVARFFTSDKYDLVNRTAMVLNNCAAISNYGLAVGVVPEMVEFLRCVKGGKFYIHDLDLPALQERARILLEKVEGI